MQAKIIKRKLLEKLNALKSNHINFLERQTFSGCPLYQQAFAQLFGDGVRTFEFQLSQHMNNLETQTQCRNPARGWIPKSALKVLGDETSSGIVLNEEIEKKELEAHYSYMAKIQEVSPEESSSTGQPLEQVQKIKNESNV
ncbi:hypothetical protein Tco_0499126 [Tanacetum coccineum]